MKIEEMVEEMNKAVNGTLSITHYSAWELHSYKINSLYSERIEAKSFKGLIEKAYTVLKKKEINNEKKI